MRRIGVGRRRGATKARRSLAALGVLTALALAAGCGGEGGGAPAPVTVGAPAPAYHATSLAGDSVSLAALRGDVVLLNVWATWCHPCREEIPVLERLHERYAPRGLEVIGVSVDAAGEEGKIRDFMRDFSMTYPVWRDPAERVSSTFLIVGVPTTFLVDRDGTLLWRHTGPVKEDDPKLAALIEQALARDST